MTEFNPPISKRDTEELIGIVNSGEAHWQKEAITLAKQELVKRNISQDEQEKVIANWDNQYEEYLEELDNTLEQNEDESYSILKMVSIFFFAPIVILNIWMKENSLFELLKGNSKLKVKQRLILLLAGAIFWFTVFELYSDYSYKDPLKLTPEEEIEFLEWKKKHGYE